MASTGTTGGSRRLRWIVAAVAVVVVLAVGGPFFYIHVIEGPPPATLTLPTATTGPGSSTTGSTEPLAGTWHVGSGSTVGYRVDEVLIGQSTTAVGRSADVSGTVTVTGSAVTAGTVTVAMATVRSDQAQRNARFDTAIMDVARYPTATLTLTSALPLSPAPTVGAVRTYSATGTLTLHGVTRTLTFPVRAERTASGVDVLADVPITFADFGIANPSIGGFVTTADHGTLEALLVLVRGAGNAAVGSGSTTVTTVAPAPVTVPSSTVPPLQLAKG
jgi:polyisoprenoid-binding protein YceI